MHSLSSAVFNLNTPLIWFQGCVPTLRDWSISIGGGGGWVGANGGGSLDFEPSQRGRSLNFELAKGGGSSYFFKTFKNFFKNFFKELF